MSLTRLFLLVELLCAPNQIHLLFTCIIGSACIVDRITKNGTEILATK